MAEQQAPKPRKLWRVIFALSLALNVAVVGMVVGFSAREKGRGMSPRGFDMALGPIGRALEHDDRRAIGEVLRNNPALRHQGRAETRAILDELVEVLNTSPFDQGALANVVQNANVRGERIQQAARAALVARIADMTDAERAALAARLTDGSRRHR